MASPSKEKHMTSHNISCWDSHSEMLLDPILSRGLCPGPSFHTAKVNGCNGLQILDGERAKRKREGMATRRE